MIEIKNSDELKKLFEDNPNKLIILDFYADWCNPCRLLGATMESIMSERSDFILAKVNIEESDDLTTDFHVRNVPTLAFMKNGFILDKSVGAIGKDMINDKINANINK